MKTVISETKLTCDREYCENSITIKQSESFPYDKGWVYLYNLKGKMLSKGGMNKNENVIITKDKDVIQFEFKDKHFCCLACELAFIDDELKKMAGGE